MVSDTSVMTGWLLNRSKILPEWLKIVPEVLPSKFQAQQKYIQLDYSYILVLIDLFFFFLCRGEAFSKFC